MDRAKRELVAYERAQSWCRDCGLYDWQYETGRWVADYETCGSCRDLDQRRKQLMESKQTNYGAKLQMFRKETDVG